VGSDDSPHLFIEGDNLEALKLIGGDYAGSVDLIYIDPPYNTGKRLAYDDDFADHTAGANSSREPGARRHAQWLSMMYPRLLAAAELLADGGVLFVSIDDTELPHLRLLLNQVLGEEAFLGVLKRRAARKTAHLSATMSDLCDYVVCYARGRLGGRLSTASSTEATRPVLNRGNAVSERVLPRGTEARCGDGVHPAGRRCVRSLEFEMLDDLVVEGGRLAGEVRVRGPFRVNQDLLARTVFITQRGGLRRSLLPEELGAPKAMSDLLDDPEFYNERGSECLADLLGAPVFEHPKPVGLIKHLVRSVPRPSGDLVVLDFFAGTCTTAQAVMEVNAEDGTHHRFIMVQRPEPLRQVAKLPDGTRLQTIADIGRVRIRKVIEGMGARAQGFRAYTVRDEGA
jgi:adenine-specific DNA-methyltransferase